MTYNYLELTPREIEVCRLIRKGFTAREVGGHLGISKRTVECHKNNVWRKLRCSSLVDLIDYTDEYLNKDLHG